MITPSTKKITMLKLLVYVRDLLVRCVTDEVNRTTSSFSRQPLDVITKKHAYAI